MNPILEKKPGAMPNTLMPPPSPAMVLSQNPTMGRQAIMPAPPVVPPGGAAGLLPKAPMAPQPMSAQPMAAPVAPPTVAAPAPAATMAAPQAEQPQQAEPSFDELTQAYRTVMRQKYPDMSKDDFEMHVNYGIAKQKGRMAAQQSKTIAKPLAKYLSALQAKENAELKYQQLGEKIKHKVAEFTLPDGRMDPGFAPYKDQLDAARLGMEAKRKKVLEHRALLNKLGVNNEDLANPVAVHEFFHSLGKSDPARHEDNPDDSDLVDYMMQP